MAASSKASSLHTAKIDLSHTTCSSLPLPSQNDTFPSEFFGLTPKGTARFPCFQRFPQLAKERTIKRDPKILPISPMTPKKAPRNLKALNVHKEENKLRKASGPGAEDEDDRARQDFWGPKIFHSPFTCALYNTGEGSPKTALMQWLERSTTAENETD